MDNEIQIKLKDNQSFDKAYEFRKDEIRSDKELKEEYWDSIKEIYDINSLLERNNIVTIPLRGCKNGKIFERINDKLYTYNWVGVISHCIEGGLNYRVEIHSRFDEGEKQYFLLYLLCNVFGINIFDIDIDSKEESDYTNILILLFLSTLLEAFADGLYKEYVRNRYNSYDFKGAIDISRHIKENNPFIGKTAYSLREYSYDNEILCLLRQTLDYIIHYYPNIWNAYMKKNPIVNEVVDILEMATPSFRINEDYSDRIKCRREIIHPLYVKYDDARKIALMILQESGQNIFDHSEDESYGILIDISWLWEEFIAIKLLDEKNYLHMLTDKSKGSLQWAPREYWYPDFIELGDEKDRRNVFDAKYKYWKWGNDEDVHQLLSYLFLTGGEVCGIIYPYQNQNSENKFEDKKLNYFHKFYSEEVKVAIYALPLQIPQSMAYKNYFEYYQVIEESVSKWKDAFETKELNSSNKK